MEETKIAAKMKKKIDNKNVLLRTVVGEMSPLSLHLRAAALISIQINIFNEFSGHVNCPEVKMKITNFAYQLVCFQKMCITCIVCIFCKTV